MYDKSDPRSALTPAKGAEVNGTSFAGAEYARFYEDPPVEDGPEGRSWYVRGQNFVLNYIEATEGARFARTGQPDEYVIIAPDPDSLIHVSTDGEPQAISGASVVFVPAGDSVVRVMCAGRIVRLVTARSTDLAAKCANAESYRTAHPNIPPFAPWPPAKDGAKIRAYPLEVAPTPGRFGSIYRCSTFMINAIERYQGPRDPKRMSPHHHEDFEQCSLAVEGCFVHHIRWPWTTDMEQWRADEHARCDNPSVVVIPPFAIHTTAGVGRGVNRLIDIFCPPRHDFSAKEGWVLNGDDYPMPEPD